MSEDPPHDARIVDGDDQAHALPQRGQASQVKVERPAHQRGPQPGIEVLGPAVPEERMKGRRKAHAEHMVARASGEASRGARHLPGAGRPLPAGAARSPPRSARPLSPSQLRVPAARAIILPSRPMSTTVGVAVTR